MKVSVIIEDRSRIAGLTNWHHRIVDSAVLLMPDSCTYIQPVALLVVRKHECAIREEETGRGIFEVSLGPFSKPATLRLRASFIRAFLIYRKYECVVREGESNLDD